VIVTLAMLDGLPCSLTWDAGELFPKVYRGRFHMTCGHATCGFWILPGLTEGQRAVITPLHVWFPPLREGLDLTPELTLEF
jgi:hypothetical protein